MPRRSRKDHPGRLHHIMNRGIAKRVVFPDRAAKRRFILLLVCAVRRGEIEVEAFCVMDMHFDMHFHLLARSPEGRILIRHIDFNPVKAGLCGDPASYLYGSARLYVLRAAGRHWLARGAVERHVCGCVGKDVIRGADYLRVFGRVPTDGEAEIVERRLRSASRGEDPLDALDSMPPVRIAAWMRRKARLAAGLAPWARILGSNCTLRSLRELEAAHGSWTVRPARNRLDAWRLIEVGLLHEACGLGVAELARRVACSASTAGLRLQRHRQVLLSDDAYARRAGQILRRLLDDAYSRGVPV